MEKLAFRAGAAIANKVHNKGLTKKELRQLERDFEREERSSSSGSYSSSSRSSSVRKCCANCYYFQIGDVYGSSQGGGCCIKTGQRQLMFTMDDMHYDEAHKNHCCSSFME